MAEKNEKSMESATVAPVDVVVPASSTKSTPFLYLCVLGATLSSMQFGYNGSVVAQTSTVMTNCTAALEAGVHTPMSLPDCFPMDDWTLGIYMGLFLIGGVIGGLFGAQPAAIYGRKRVILANNIFFVLGGAMISFSSHYAMLCVGRVLLGIGAGVSSAVVPMYISEISPINIRGILGSCTQLSIVIGSITTATLGLAWANPHQWRLLFAFTWVIVLVQVAIFAFSAESPRWLVLNRRFADAENSLRRLRGMNDVDAELKSIAEDLGMNTTKASSKAVDQVETPAEDASSQRMSFYTLLTAPSLRRPLITAIGLHLAQQLSGINAVLCYSTTIFKSLYDQEMAIVLTVPLTLNNLVVIVATMFWIDRFGRRALLLTGMGTMAISAIMTSVAMHVDAPAWVIVTAIMLFMTGFGVGMGTVPWLIVPELFPIRAVANASTLCVAINWLTSFLVTLVGAPIYTAIGLDIFAIYGALLVFFIAFTYFFVPETKGVKVDELIEDN